MSDSAEVDKLKVKDQILHLLKTGGPQNAATIAEQLQVSPMAIRQHLQTLQAEKLVVYEEERRPVGRPVKLWRLTAQATRLFPDSHADLLVNLLRHVETIYGTTGLETVVAERTRSQIETYVARIPEELNWRERVAMLAQLRGQEGYMAEVIDESDDTILLVENHCSINQAAQNFNHLCNSELAVFTSVLGSSVNIERVEHIVRGDRRCAYRISPKILESNPVDR
jgi:predicted ArsR family transcriptional regulator